MDASAERPYREERSAPRWMRKAEGAPPSVEVVATGPPDISLDDRAELLAALRRTVSEAGFGLRTVRGGTFRRRVVAEGMDGLDVLLRDEECADTGGHWWMHDVTWGTRTEDSKVVYWADPDGWDLVFYGWGQDASRCLTAIATTLGSHRP